MKVDSSYPPNFSDLRPFLPFCEEAVPIFMYHKLGPRPWGTRHRSIYLSKGWFLRQMNQLKAEGFSVVSLSEWRDFGKPGRRCVLTFDDGSCTVLRHGAEEMAQRGFRGIQYLVADQIGGFNAWDVAQGEVRDALMTREEIRRWLDLGHEIGSHTVSHPRLTKIPREKAREEITASKARLEDLFGIPIRHFCYPYGNWNDALRDMVGEVGYETATTTDVGFNGAGIDPLALRRIGARYPKRSPKQMLGALLRVFRGR